MGIKDKSIGTILDELIVTNIKCFYFQEIINKSDDKEEVFEAAKAAQEMNSRRSKLIMEIDKYFNDQNTIGRKTY